MPARRKKMKLKSDADTISFLNAVKACAGDVCFVTSEGDRLNLKSILSCYLFSAVRGKGELSDKGEVLCSDDRDYMHIQSFLIWDGEKS